jgi:hypothetical protein
MDISSKEDVFVILNYAKPEPVRYRNKETQSGTGMLWYRTEMMMNAGMPMPMPSYAK